jgi:hypothetical protein
MTLKTDRLFPSELQSLIVTATARLSASCAVERLWARDYRLWKQDPTEIANRLGWLTIIEYMDDRTADLQAFAASVKKRGIRDVVLFGMGGSSLGPRTGIFLQLVDRMVPDLSIPGKPYTFGTLAQAQAAGDIEALQAHEQQAIVLPLGKNPIATIQALTKSLAPRKRLRRATIRQTGSGRARKR